MSGGVIEKHTDSDPLATGTHKGASAAASIRDPGADFKSCGVRIGLAIYNETQDTNGLVTAVTEDTVTDDTNTWDNGDTYAIYKTATKDSAISTIGTDRSRGWKSTNRADLDRGWRPEDVDLDRDEPNVFGPRQPENPRR